MREWWFTKGGEDVASREEKVERWMGLRERLFSKEGEAVASREERLERWECLNERLFTKGGEVVASRETTLRKLVVAVNGIRTRGNLTIEFVSSMLSLLSKVSRAPAGARNFFVVIWWTTHREGMGSYL